MNSQPEKDSETNITTPSNPYSEALSYVQIALCLPGIVGSAVAVAVWVKRLGKLNSCSVQLAFLSVYDVVFLLASLVLTILRVAGDWYSRGAEAMLCLRTLALWGVVYTTLNICLERCLCVALPRWAGARFTVGLALKTAVLVLVLSLAFTLPFLLDLIINFYVAITYLFIFGLSSIAILITFVILLCRLCRCCRRQSSGVQPEEETSDEGERQLSVLVTVLSGWYVVSMPLPTLYFLREVIKGNLEYSEAVAVVESIVILSCCFHFVFLYALLPPFRQEVSGCVRAGWGRVRERAAGRHRRRLTTASSSNDTEPSPKLPC